MTLRPKTIILLVLALVLLAWFFIIFSDITPEEQREIVLPPGASLLREPFDEDQLYEKSLGEPDTSQRETKQMQERDDPDNDDDEDERYERERAYTEEETLEVGLPKFLNEGEKEEKAPPEEEEKELLQEQKAIKKSPTALSGGKGGGGFILYERGEIIFSEIAWMGTLESATHEWIELRNTTDQEVLLSGFSLVRGDETFLIGESGDKFSTAHHITAGGYFLLERSDEATPPASDKLYDGSLDNAGEVLTLRDALGNEIDKIDMSSGWEAGSNEIHVEGYKPTMSNVATSTGALWKDGVPTPKAVNKEAPSVEKNNQQQTTDNAKQFIPHYEPLSIVVSEIAWMGDEESSANEWIELYYTSSSTIDLTGWMLEAEDGSPTIPLSGIIAPNTYVLLERTDDDSVKGILADVIYTGALGNEGEVLVLRDPAGNEIDRVDAWYGGDNVNKKTMQRDDMTVLGTQSTNWFSAAPTPKAINQKDPESVPEPSSPSFPLSPLGYSLYDVVINEIAWMGTAASAGDEWIELKNATSTDSILAGWKLTFAKDSSSTPELIITFEESDILPAGGFFVLERNATSTIQTIEGKIYTGSQMNNTGEYLQLLDPNGNVIDIVDGSNGWPAGYNQTSPQVIRKSMERSSDVTSWYTFEATKAFFSGEIITDGKGNPILGTPGCANSEEKETCAE